MKRKILYTKKIYIIVLITLIVGVVFFQTQRGNIVDILEFSNNTEFIFTNAIASSFGENKVVNFSDDEFRNIYKDLSELKYYKVRSYKVNSDINNVTYFINPKGLFRYMFDLSDGETKYHFSIIKKGILLNDSKRIIFYAVNEDDMGLLFKKIDSIVASKL